MSSAAKKQAEKKKAAAAPAAAPAAKKVKAASGAAKPVAAPAKKAAAPAAKKAAAPPAKKAAAPAAKKAAAPAAKKAAPAPAKKAAAPAKKAAPAQAKKAAAPAKKAAAPAKKAAPAQAKKAKAKAPAPTKKGAQQGKQVKGKAAPAAVVPKTQAKPKAEGAAAKKKKQVPQRQRMKMIIARPAKSFRIGQDLPPKRDMTRMVKWPKYIRLQRQRHVLLKRLKMPPPLNQFNHVLDRATAINLFKLMHKYRPEEKLAKRARHASAAKALALARRKDEKAGKRGNMKQALAAINSKKPIFLKKGLNHVTSLVEKGKAQLVVIAHDVDPIELVVWLPALCRKKKVPYCIVKSRSRLGALIHTKKAAVVALCNVRKADRAAFDTIVEICRSQFNDNTAMLRQWSEQKFGIKHRQAEAVTKRRLLKEESQKRNA